MTKKEITFEQAIQELEEVVEKLDDNEMTLDESVELYKRGMELSKICSDKLEEAEQKITIISDEKTP